jgi:hypothetical protein
VDALLVRVARGRWALDLALGEALDVLATGSRVVELGFSGLGDYARERLGIAASTAQKMVRFARRLRERPLLRAAVQGEVTFLAAEAVLPRASGEDEAAWVERARRQTVSALQAAVRGDGRAGLSDDARHAEDDSIDEWIERGEHVPCITLRRELQAREETQMCARGEVEIWAPRSVAAVIALACSAARKAAGRWISTGECLARIAQHFVDVWERALPVRRTLPRKVLERDGFLCQVPGCSRAADHAHHIQYRSRGGSDELSNQTSMCSVHHLQGVHMGRIRVSGLAPDRLRWEVATPEGWVPMT